MIPEGYAGWLCITYGVPSAPELPKEGQYRLAVFPNSGVLETSSPLLPGHDYHDEHFFYQGTVRRPIDARERGGGFTFQPNLAAPVTFKFWVSRDAATDFPVFVEGKPDSCGPFPNYHQRPRSPDQGD